ncbi:MAG: ABC-F family ATP-binding cassette domain-containing protein [Chloroflexi bacterium]|nr:ABC-F family ATP-binding cassette domain-containing protein [Chloroflexota bacterium]
MSLINVSKLGKSYGPEDIFADISFSIPEKGRIAIVGPNGVGKTSLLRILAGEEAASSGSVQRANRLEIGYLPQEAGFDAQHTLWEECLDALVSLRNQEEELASLEAKLSATPNDKDVLARYGKLQEAFELGGGYTYESTIKQTLTGLGFTEIDYDLRLSQLSGGQRTRALLARLLLSKPDLLLLDEPTNHLDIPAVEWLESYLRDWEGTSLIVSHDRYFLDKVVNNIWEMRPNGFELFRGNYSAYLLQRQERWEERQQHVKTERERLAKELDYIRKNIAGQRTNQAKGKLSRLSRQIAAIEKHGFQSIRGKKWGEFGSRGRPMRVEEAARRLKALSSPTNRPLNLGLNMKAPERSGNIILRANNLELGYPQKSLFTIEKIELRRLEFAALTGPNGSGKTTFLKAILEQHTPLAGELTLGASLNIGYFAQAHEDLDPKLTLIEEIEKVAPNMLLAEIRSYLGGFLFSGDDQYKQVTMLSGGERGRLALAKLALSDANFLLLDEPTNHLDIPSQEVLQKVLAEFNGTILMVSHDRYLIDALATQVWAIDPESKSMQVYGGNYSAYRTALDAELEKNGSIEKVGPEAQKVRAKKVSKHERKRRQSRINTLEVQIAELEKKLAILGKKLENPPSEPSKVQRLGEQYGHIQGQLEGIMQEWEALHTD